MATATEYLRLIVDADTKGISKEMSAIGAAAERDLGKTDEKLKRVGASMVTFGAGMATAGAVVGAGLFAMARMSEDAEMQSRKLANSVANSDSAFRLNGDALRDQAQALQQVTAADGDAIIGAQSLLVQFGQTEDQVSSLTPLMVDLSRKMGVDLDIAAKAIGKSVDGSSGALKKMGIVVDETKFAIDPFAATVDALRATVGGFAEQEGATFSGQLEILKNNLGDLGESVGGGAVSVLSSVVGGLTDLAGAAGGANPAVGETVGKLGAIASIGAVVIGSVSMVAGQVLKMRDAFTVAGEDGTRSLTRVGKAAAGLGAVGGAIAAWAALDAIMMSVSENATEVASGLDRMRAAATKSDALSALTDQAQRFDSTWENVKEGVLEWGPIWGHFTDKLSDSAVDIGGTRLEVKDLDQALGDLAGTGSWDQLSLALDALSESGGELNRGKLDELIDRYRERVDAAGAAAGSAAGPMGDLTGEFDEQGNAIDDVVDSYEEYNSVVLGSLDGMLSVADAAGNLSDAQRDVMTATDDLNKIQAEGKTGSEEYFDAVTALDEANSKAARSAIDQQQAIQKLATDIDTGKVSADSAAAAIRDLATSGAITRTQADLLSISVAQSSSKLQELGRQKPTPTIDADDRPFFAKLWNVGAAPMPQKTSTVDANDAPFRSWLSWLNGLRLPDKTVNIYERTFSTGGNLQVRAAGGPVKAGEPYLVGEKGPEIVVPGQNAFVIPNHRTRGGDGASAGGVHITVNTMSSVGVERAVLDAIAAANRRGASAIPGVR